jgi:tetratricopeptide (TPR) repeat protein
MSDLKTLHDFVEREDFKNAYTLGTILLNKNPEDPQTLYLMGYTLRATNQLGVALPVLSKAIARYPKDRPQQPNLWMTYAATLHDLNRWEDAEKAFTSVLSMLPDDPKVMANIAATYVQRGAWRDAKNWADRALEICAREGKPPEHIAEISKGFACLSLGRWKEAWKYHEALYGNHVHTRVYCNPPEPEWDGTKGQTVVVQTDQGVGDIIMFSQCLPELQADCKEVIVECASRLVNYFRRNFPGVIVYGTGKDQTATWPLDHKIDASIHISALGKFYRNADKDFPRKAYITPDPARLVKWKEWLHAFPSPHVGIAWKGGIQQTQTHLRSLDLAELRPILEKPGTFVDLSYTDSAHEVALWNIDNASQVIRPPVDTRDYEDTIALLAALDEVVSVTTTVVHACGALGRSAHVLVPEVAQWRYAYKRDGMIWYPEAVKLHRQLPGEDGWSFAVKRVAKCV